MPFSPGYPHDLPPPRGSRPESRLADTTLDAIQDLVAVLDASGVILEVNSAWQRHAERNRGIDPRAVGVGADYLEACRRAAADKLPGASETLAGITALLAGECQEFTAEYPWQSPSEPRWFRQVVTRPAAPAGGAVIVHSDITSLKRAELALEAGLRFEHLLAELSQDFVNLSPDQVDSRIESWLPRLAESFGVDCGTFGEFLERGRLRITHVHCRPGLPPVPKAVLEDPPRWSTARLRRGEMICISSLDELPPEAAEEKMYARQLGLKSVLALPLEAGSTRLGYLAVSALRAECAWTPAAQQQLGMAREIFANALQRQYQELELRAALAEIHDLKERLEAENVYLREEIHAAKEYAGIVGKSASLRRVLNQVTQVAPTDASVLLLGETGTGKELLARAVHANSPRKDRPFITVNCAALPASLIESELFGHEKGAFTGALLKKIGRFELADGGTLFLDEIAELAPELQSKLLRVVQEGTFERLGSNRTLHVNVRIIAATNRDLGTALQQGHFRPDLYYRLSVFPIVVPPLRERREDIPLLVWHFVTIKQRRLGRRVDDVQPAIMDALRAYDWPGNIRELENVIEHALILSPARTLMVEPSFVRPMTGPTATLVPAAQDLESVERDHILGVLEACDWRIKGAGAAAEKLGLNPSTLYFRMKKLGIKPPPRR